MLGLSSAMSVGNTADGHLPVQRGEVPDPVTGAAGLPHNPGKPVHDIVDVLCRHTRLPLVMPSFGPRSGCRVPCRSQPLPTTAHLM
ncbi:hypothetical protein [Streptomyces sp. NPDC056672]|uniref:hypothetical protein n=1 Tax=Streptomyces sp. NPDC056672 TaxID=3345906 RepID=UPI00367EB908